MASEPDIHDGDPWLDVDDADLRRAVAIGSTPDDAAQFLCRSGTLLDVVERAKALGPVRDQSVECPKCAVLIPFDRVGSWFA